MQKQVYQTPPIHDVHDLKQRVLDAWADYGLFCKLKIWEIKFKLSYPGLFCDGTRRYGVPAPFWREEISF